MPNPTNGREPPPQEVAEVAAPSSDRWLIMLVHGVGEQTPGAMIDAVSGAIRSVHQLFPRSEEFVVTHIEDPAASDGWYPLYLKHFELPNGRRVGMGEVYWADLSKIRGGTFEFLVGIYRLIFGLRFVSDQAAKQDTFWAEFLRRLLYLTILIARGPWLAILTVGLVHCVPEVARWAARATYVPGSWVDWLSDLRIYTVLGVLVALTGVVLAIHAPKAGKRLRAYGFFLALAAITITLLCHRHGFLTYINSIYEGKLGETLGAAHFLATSILLAAIIRGVAFLSLGISLIVLIPAVALATPDRRAGLQLAYTSTILQLLIWTLALGPLNYIIDITYEHVNSSQTHHLSRDAVLFLSVRMLFLYIIVALSVITWICRSIWAKAHPRACWSRSSPPRLIVGLAVSLVCFAAALYLIVEYAIAGWGLSVDTYRSIHSMQADHNPTDIDYHAYPICGVVWIISFLLLCSLWFTEGLARLGLHVVTDVINHFNHPGENFPVRRQIESRFHEVFERLIVREHPTRITVIAHSQGTVITFNSLHQICSSEKFAEKLKDIWIDVITVGSPLTHIYQHYFPRQYPPHADQRWEVLHEIVKRWQNIFRTDDYVGTFIRSYSLDERSQDWPENIPAKPGGHTAYWDFDVFEKIGDAVP